MTLTLYNTLTRQQERFTPLKKGAVGLYACGPTVYDRAHLGNARPVIVFDILRRLLALEYNVTYVRNITDIDDKIIRASQETGTSIDVITQKTTRLFQEDMAALGNLPPTHEPRATNHVQDMIRLIEILLKKGHAYEASQHVLFSVKSYPDYGVLSRSNQDEILAGARIDVAPYKKDPSDFVLWKPSSDNEPGWNSPWGRGRPGWHIECSAMSSTFLGNTFDIHGGGRDLIFPHHENEIAQSCAAHGNGSFAKYWMHNGILTVNGEKMSKSLGNFITVDTLLGQAKGETVRYAVLMTHYRHSLDWTDQSLPQAKAALDRFYTALEGFEEGAPQNGKNSVDSDSDRKSIDEDFLTHLYQDINTPAAFARLHALTSEINKTSDPKAKKILQKNLKTSANLLGLLGSTPQKWFQESHSTGARPFSAEGDQKANEQNQDALSEATIDKLIEDRLTARRFKNFKEADAIRDRLLEKGGTS